MDTNIIYNIDCVAGMNQMIDEESIDLTGKNVCEQLPTEELWDKLQTILEFNIPYDKISQTYHAQMGLTDVWDDVNFYEEKDRIHPTQKPQKLLARLILASSDEDDIVLDPFMGGGSTALACINNKRNCCCYHIWIRIQKEQSNICKDPITLQTRHCFGLLLTTSNHLSY